MHQSTEELSKEKLRLFVIPVPTMTIQRALVSQTTHINKIIELRKTELFELDSLVKARFVELFGDPVINTKMLPVHQLSEYIEFLTNRDHTIVGGLTGNPQKDMEKMRVFMLRPCWHTFTFQYHLYIAHFFAF